MIRVLVADDHAIVREGLRRLLGAASDIEVAGEAATGDAALEQLAAARVDVLLLDISMPGKNFLDLLREVRARHPRTRVLVLSGHAEDEYAVRALRAGASGYVAKERSPQDLLQAIRKVQGGGRYVSPTLAERLAAGLTDDADAVPHEALSDREYQVLQLLGAGLSVKEIGGRLVLSAKTVSTYRQRILEKLGLKTTADLIRYAVQRNLSA
jgi:DNA-binding NarL/FixJ family response regulator